MIRTYVWLIAIICGILFLLWAFQARAHDAPSGWSYSNQCCSGKDCAPYHKPVTEVPEGYLIEETGEVIPYDMRRVSGDDEYHRCVYQSGPLMGKTRCLYVPDFEVW